MSQPDATSRLVTFESDTREQLVVLAGNSERDHRTIFSDRVEGRYAIVPVNDLVEDQEFAADDLDGLLLEDMRIAGRTAVLPSDGAGRVELVRDGKQVMEMDRAGAYGLLWIPQD